MERIRLNSASNQWPHGSSITYAIKYSSIVMKIRAALKYNLYEGDDAALKSFSTGS
jgi:hypothetical protein